jgi:hypothetical protein
MLVAQSEAKIEMKIQRRHPLGEGAFSTSHPTPQQSRRANARRVKGMANPRATYNKPITPKSVLTILCTAYVYIDTLTRKSVKINWAV